MRDFYQDIERYKNRVALVTDRGEHICYNQLIADGDALMAAAEPRHLMFLVCENDLPSVCAYVGALRRGVVPVLINPKIEESLYQVLFNRYKPSYLFAPIKEGADVLQTYGGYALMKTGAERDYAVDDDLALLLTTSGSTGSPKLVRQSYENIVANANAIASYLDITDDDRAITTMPMSYTYGLSILNSHLLMGARVILNAYTLMEKAFWTLLETEKATTFGGVPYIYEMLKKLRFERMKLDSITYLTQAGGKLSKALCEEFTELCAQKGMRFIVMYGQTEATARMSYLPWEMATRKAGSIGIAIPGGTFALVDDHQRLIEAPHQTGELLYTGKNVTLGYAESCRDLAKGDERGGVLHTGDMAMRDEEGYYYIVGRKKRFLKLFGNRVNLDEVEQLLNRRGIECVCAGVDDKLKIYTTAKEGHRDIIRSLSTATGINASAFEAVAIDEIPRNEAGKILYSALK